MLHITVLICLIQAAASMQARSLKGDHDLVMMHIPFNFGNTIAKNAVFGHGENLNQYMMAMQASQKYHPVAVGDHECEGAVSNIESMEDCAAAAQILWPEGFEPPCTYPIWADNILPTDEPNEPYGCLALKNPGSHGCGLRWNPTGHQHDCIERGLTCEVVCWEADEPTQAPTQLKMGAPRSADKTTAVDAEVDEEIEIEEIEIDVSVDNTTVDVNITVIDVNITVDENVTMPEGSNASIDKP